MKGATMLAILQALSVMQSFSRPAVSNDKPYSESLFRTLKTGPRIPHRPFDSLLAARQWVGGFVNWYNHERRQHHADQDALLLGKRDEMYRVAKT